MKRYLRHSRRFENMDLDEFVRNVERNGDSRLSSYSLSKYTSAVGNKPVEELSKNITNQIKRDENSLENFARYQRIWYNSLLRSQRVRDKLNEKGIGYANYKANTQQSQSATGDIPM